MSPAGGKTFTVEISSSVQFFRQIDQQHAQEHSFRSYAGEMRMRGINSILEKKCFLSIYVSSKILLVLERAMGKRPICLVCTLHMPQIKTKLNKETH